eukprot:3089399-Rhodomonas_salina.1
MALMMMALMMMAWFRQVASCHRASCPDRHWSAPESVRGVAANCSHVEGGGGKWGGRTCFLTSSVLRLSWHQAQAVECGADRVCRQVEYVANYASVPQQQALRSLSPPFFAFLVALHCLSVCLCACVRREVGCLRSGLGKG